MLAQIGSLLMAESRDIDIVGRLGGEEFSVRLPGCDSAGAGAFTQHVRLALATSHTRGLPCVRISAGVHAAIAPPDVKIMLQRADAALYDAKRAGTGPDRRLRNARPAGGVCGLTERRLG